jgi:hypothetical protein
MYIYIYIYIYIYVTCERVSAKHGVKDDFAFL